MSWLFYDLMSTSLSSFLGRVLAFGSLQLHVALKYLEVGYREGKWKGSKRGRENAWRKMKISRKQEVEREVFKFLKSQGCSLPTRKRQSGVFSCGNLCSAAWTHVQCCQQSSASVSALLFANLYKQVHSLQNCFKLSVSGGSILFWIRHILFGTYMDVILDNPELLTSSSNWGKSTIYFSYSWMHALLCLSFVTPSSMLWPG